MKRPGNDKAVGSRLHWLFFETLVIVLGVLVALAINAWWNERQDREMEREYLVRLLLEIRGDIDYLHRFSTELPKRKLEALQEIAPVVRRQEPVPDDLLTFFSNVSRGGMGGMGVGLWVARTTYEDLVSTGNLRLITNTSLREILSSYHMGAVFQRHRLMPRVSGYVSFVHAHIPGEIREAMTLEDVEPFGIDRAIAGFTSPEFESLLNKETNLAIFMADTEIYDLGLEVEKALVAELENMD